MMSDRFPEFMFIDYALRSIETEEETKERHKRYWEYMKKVFEALDKWKEMLNDVNLNSLKMLI